MSTHEGFAIPQTILRYFDLTSSPYSDTILRGIAERRRTYPESSLFLDQLFTLASIDGQALYPPTSPAALRRLIHTIRNAEIDRLKQDCFIYYLLLDLDRTTSSPVSNGDTPHPNGVDKGKRKAVETPQRQAEEFARRRCLPQVWRGFIFGYWALDHALWEAAVESLSNPAITSVNFVPQIFTLLSTHVSPPLRALSLVHSLFTALSPPLDSEALIHLRTISLASASSLSDAFSFIRSQPPDTQRGIRDVVFRWALGASRIPAGLGPPSVQPTVLTALLHLPLHEDESVHLTHFLTHPPRSTSSAALDVLHELVTVRLIHQGQYAECLALDKALAGSGVGKQVDRQKRRERVKEFISILPEVQRRVLELDGEVRREEEDGWRDTDGDVEMPKTNGDGVVAPVPIRLPARFNLNGDSSPRPQTPASRILQPVPRHVSSPFSGPPQFARTDSPGGIAPGTPNRGTPVSRLVSGSPFNLPRTPVVDVPRPSRRIINDDDEDEEAVRDTRRKRQSSAGKAEMAPASKRAEPEPEADVEMDQPEAEAAEKKAPAETPSHIAMPPPPVPAPKPKTPARKSSRQTLAPSARQPSPSAPSPQPPTPLRSTRRQTTDAPEPGSRAPEPEATPKKTKTKSKADEARANEAEDVPQPMPGAFIASGSGSAPTPRSRLTRSASRAILDEETPNPGSPAKRPRTRTRTARSPAASESGEKGRTARRGTREPSVASSAGGRGRGSRASVTPGPGGRGDSPTGSVASTRSRRGEGSVTPRVTRNRK